MVEMLLVVSIIGILVGMTFPAISMARERAKYMRAIAFNAQINRDPDALINYNFEAPDYTVKYKGRYRAALYNGAAGCVANGYNPTDYSGILMNMSYVNPNTNPVQSSPEWVSGGGRWKFKNALLFNGTTDYVFIPGTYNTNFDPSKDDFSVAMWVKFNVFSGDQYLFGKSRALTGNNSQYNVNIRANRRIRTCFGGKNKAWTSPLPEVRMWYHVAVVNRAGKAVECYLNGKLMGPTAVSVPSNKMIQAFMNIGAYSNNGKNPFEASAGMRNYFNGFMDEFVMYNRALSAKEIEGHYKMGTPY